MSTYLKTIASSGALIVALFLLGVTADREYINLIPLLGVADSVVLQSAERYEQTFIAQRPTVSRLGIYLRPTSRSVPPGELTVTLRRGQTELGTGHIPTAVIDSEGVTHVRFNPPLKTEIGEELRMELSVPPVLSGAMRALQRRPDPSFDASNVSFSINGAVQPAPLAYQVYYQYASPVVRTIGILLLILIAYWWAPGFFTTPYGMAFYSIGLTTGILLPLWQRGEFSLLLAAGYPLTLVGMWLYARQHNLSPAAQLLVAHAYALTSWFALHYRAGREVYILLGAVVPWVLYGIARFVPRSRHLVVTTGFVILFLMTITLASQSIPLPGTVAVNPRDIFLDPYQVASSQKTSDPSASWDHFGSYLGVIPVSLAILGILASRARTPGLIVSTLAVLALVTVPTLSGTLHGLMAMPVPHLILWTTFGLSVCAGIGLDTLRSFLGPQSGVTAFIVGSLVFLALLDGLQVLAETLTQAHL